MSDVEFHPEAQTDYLSALSWYQSRSPRTAARFETEMERMLNLIASSPEMFPPYDPEHRFVVLRRFPYSVIYQTLPGKVYVIAVAHSNRLARYWQGRT